MAYIDTNLEFSDAQAITTTAISANVYDLFTMGTGGGTSDVTPNTRLDVGLGEDVWLVISVPTALTGGTSITFSLESADNAALSTNATVHYQSAAVVTADLTAGAKPVRVKIPSADYRRYLGVRYTVSGTYGAGAVDAYLTYEAVDANKAYKSGFTVQ